MAIPRKYRQYFFTGTGTPGVRFLTGNEPSQLTFQQLFDSVGFILEASDAATFLAQGFVKIATDANSYSLNSTADSDGYTKTIQPHQLPSIVKSISNPDTAIHINKSSSSLGRVGGNGAQYEIQNTLEISASDPLTNPIEVVQIPGENALLVFDFNKLPEDPGTVYTSNTDPVKGFLINKLGNNSRGEWENVSETAVLKVIDKLHEITIYGGTGAQYLSHFTGNKGIVGGPWEGWALCDGAVYQNSSLVSVKTPDLRKSFPVGWDPAGLYPDLFDGVDNSAGAPQRKDSGGLQGEKSHLLTGLESGTGVHTHTTEPHRHQSTDLYLAGGGESVGNSNAVFTQIEQYPNTTFSTVIVNSNDATDAMQAHENRPPFFVVAFVQYIG